MQRGTDPLSATSLLRDVKRTSVVWDQEAGRYVSVPVSASESNKNSRSLLPLQGPKVVGYGRKPLETQQESSSVNQNLNLTERLSYTGDNIFFGGPLLRNERGSGLGLGLMQRDPRFKRDAGSNQLPVFIPSRSSFDRIHPPPSGSGLK